MKNHAISPVAIIVLGIMGASFLTALASGREIVMDSPIRAAPNERWKDDLHGSCAEPAWLSYRGYSRQLHLDADRAGRGLDGWSLRRIAPQNGQAPWLRAVVTFDADNSSDQSQSIDFAEGGAPDSPRCLGPCPGDRRRPRHPE